MLVIQLKMNKFVINLFCTQSTFTTNLFNETNFQKFSLSSPRIDYNGSTVLAA